ncbi:response regulator transcription factor [Cryptosporangium aurantiacum]|uniref:Two component transcriptional regulator, LuxR family n=1 Tax=Cryptosporangium aurantiacum TaxID=134849 RepID=A0A1M7QA00_9ACTN|nr:response regulator transcription factor [Cryptosporangium aurantiacum]SHN27166.1 two component transcriptional regulator, LuxR family [Cryptosporangium aurantiacum]
MTIRVMIVDDHPLYREGLVTALAAMPDVEVVAECADGAAAVAAVDDAAPDVVLMDLQMPGLTGMEATRQVVDRRPGTAVLVLTMLEGDDAVFAAMRAGARGYLLKGAGRAEIARAIEAVAGGEVVFSAGVASRVLAWFTSGGTQALPFPELTTREREILDLVARGLTNSAIAGRLFLSPKTVRNHVSNVFTKLQVADRAEAVARARDAGLGRSLPG